MLRWAWALHRVGGPQVQQQRDQHSGKSFGNCLPNKDATDPVFQFTNSSVIDSENGCRIKTNYNATGFVANITYSNIALQRTTAYGIDVQQDYLNGGPTGNPSNGVLIQDVAFLNVTGTATAKAQDYYILCGEGSCSGFTLRDVSITGGGVASRCNYPATGCPN